MIMSRWSVAMRLCRALVQEYMLGQAGDHAPMGAARHNRWYLLISTGIMENVWYR